MFQDSSIDSATICKALNYCAILRSLFHESPKDVHMFCANRWHSSQSSQPHLVSACINCLFIEVE